MYLNKQVPGMSPHLSVGQEAVAVGRVPCHAERGLLSDHPPRARPRAGQRREHEPHALAEILGKESGYCHGRGGSMHIADVSLNIIGANGIVGGGLPIAVGVCPLERVSQEERGNVCFFGDAAANIGTFHESLNMAAIMEAARCLGVRKQPVRAEYVHKDTLAGGSIAHGAVPTACPAVPSTATTFWRCYETAIKAVDHARSGKGPSLIEAVTYRWYGHGASDNRSYRTRDEENEWKAKCPIIKYADYLAKEGIVSRGSVRS